MTTAPRASRESVTFARPFSLRGLDGVRPAGTYVVETEEEPIEGLSFPAYRRVATLVFVPARPGGMAWGQIAAVDPAELRAALERDAAAAG